MRLSNKRKEGIYQLISSVVIFFSIFGIVVYLADIYEFKTFGWKAVAFMIIGILSFIIYYLRGRPIFEYDSDGETINFRNRNIVSLLGNDISDDFPKYKLVSYDIVNALIFKRLYIHISSKKTNSVTLKYDISYLTNKEIKDLKISLNRVIKMNKQEIKL